MIEFSYKPKYHDVSLPLRVCGNSLHTTSSCFTAKNSKANKKFVNDRPQKCPLPDQILADQILAMTFQDSEEKHAMEESGWALSWFSKLDALVD